VCGGQVANAAAEKAGARVPLCASFPRPPGSVLIFVATSAGRVSRPADSSLVGPRKVWKVPSFPGGYWVSDQKPPRLAIRSVSDILHEDAVPHGGLRALLSFAFLFGVRNVLRGRCRGPLGSVRRADSARTRHPLGPVGRTGS